MGGSKQELVVTIHKMVEIEDKPEFCIGVALPLRSCHEQFTSNLYILIHTHSGILCFILSTSPCQGNTKQSTEFFFLHKKVSYHNIVVAMYNMLGIIIDLYLGFKRYPMAL